MAKTEQYGDNDLYLEIVEINEVISDLTKGECDEIMAYIYKGRLEA